MSNKATAPSGPTLAQQAAWRVADWTEQNQKDVEAVVGTLLSSRGVPPAIAKALAGKACEAVAGGLRELAATEMLAPEIHFRDTRDS